MDRRGSFDFTYSRSEIFAVQKILANPRSYLTLADRYEVVVGARIYCSEEIKAYPFSSGFVPNLTANALAASGMLNLCDRNKKPYIENVPLPRFINTFIGAQSNAAGAATTNGPGIPVKLVPRVCSLAGSYIQYVGAGKPIVAVELFYQ